MMIKDILHRKTRGAYWMRLLLLAAMANGTWSMASGQVIIGGNVYGGGNQGDLGGSTNVTVRSCVVQGDVYGGARMANIGKRTFVNIDGENASGTLYITTVYGGNDIAGTIGSAIESTDTLLTKVPSELEYVLRGDEKKADHPEKNYVNNTWNAFIRTSKMATENKTHRLIVGRLFGGGNGDYNYSTGSESGKYNVTVGDTIYENVAKPELGKTYIEITGGEIAHVYGGGNNVTVTNNTTICINNESKGVYDVLDQDNVAGEFKILAQYLDLSTFQGNYRSYDYNHSRVFGGNNKADMAIRPVWNIQRGKIRDLYSGGNEGDMTSPVGLIMDIDPIAANKSELFIYNVYGGCRRADVHPNVADVTTVQLPTSLGYQFPAGFSARTIVRGGHITNVYGGNDISGRVFGGNAIGIYTTVYGDIYGGGNGSYSYTDNAELGAMTAFRDYYYNPTEVKAEEQAYNDPSFDFSSDDKGVQSVEALNIFRPNAEQVSIRLKGNSASDPTYIKGAVYLGGNSASLSTSKSTQYAAGSGPKVEVKIGSHVYANSLFLGNNGANMVTEEILHRYAGYLDTDGNTQDAEGEGRYNFSEMDLTKADIFAKYMEGCAMPLRPSVVFDSRSNGDPADYDAYTAYFGSIFCGGNRGSMTWPGTNTINLDKKIIVWDKFVGGCNDANIAATAYNAEYLGGMIGTEVEQATGGMEDEQGNIKDCLIFNFKGLRMEPKRWIDDADPTAGLEWNTYIGENTAEVPTSTGASTEDDINRRLRNGNIYGGCYNSGHINGNVVINLLDDIVDRDNVFDEVEKENPILGENDSYTIKKRNSGVILDEQGMDPLGKALNVFGGGYGPASEVWGSTTINLKSGFTFQIYGGGEKGPIGKSREDAGKTAQTGDYVFNNKHYYYDKRFSTYVNLMDTLSAGQASNNVAETVFMYAGSLEAPISGNTRINLGNGRVYDSFGGSCNADILGHTETYVGHGILKDGTTLEGFPYVIDIVYGANDLGGAILGELRAEGTSVPADAATAKADADFTDRVTSNGQDINKVYLYDASTNTNPRVLTASSYVEYTQGRAIKIFAGAYGKYDYASEDYRDYCDENGKSKAGFTKPREGNAFVNFKPVSNNANKVDEVYGGSEGDHYMVGRDSLQERSYVLVDIPQNATIYEDVVFFGAGAYSGLGMGIQPEAVKADPDRATAVVDLFRGQIHNVYGGSYNEGVTRRTVVNVPEGSTVKFNNVFGGAYGANNLYPCDVYESVVNFRSNDAGDVTGGIYGGNNNARRTLYSQVNIYAKLWNNQARGYTGYVYGGGLGSDTWAQYTEVNLCDGSWVYKVYGGGSAGKVLNKTSLMKWKAANPDMDLRIGNGYNGADGKGYGYEEYDAENGLAKYFEMANDIDAGYIREAPDRGIAKKKFNTNVRILTGGFVEGYCYGGGYGSDAIVSGDTYIALVGGKVKRDIYAAGESGAVRNYYEAVGSKTFTATANAYAKAGDVRNIYGGGWRGDVGYHLKTTQDTTNDDLGLSNVVIGNLRPDASYTDGDPAIERNAYGAGEGGSVFGKSCLTINNGHIGYKYDAETEKYVEVLDDANVGDNLLDESGNAFGGGYVANSYTDESYVTMYGGVVRGGLYGGGEIGPVGRGALRTDNDTYFPPTTAANMNHEAKIYKPGSTNVYMYGGHVLRDVFGGGRGFDNWGGDGTFYYSAEDIAKMDLMAKGYVFGTTNVSIRGGEIGTPEGVAKGYGNVFGGGNIGYVYSGTGRKVGTRQSDEQLVDGMPTDGGGYYYEGGDKTASMTVDCNVDVSPYCMVKADDGITIDGTTYAKGTFVPTEELNKLKNKTSDAAQWNKLDVSGITIRNAVFAGGNVSVGSDQIYANANTVFGNATAALRDVYHRDLISIGTEHVGGLYGDGNLTFVDGYRELHIGNYGTDYYSLDENITLEQYRNLNDRERAYFELQFECQRQCTDKNDKVYKVGDKLSQEEYKELFEGTEYYNNTTYWVEYGFCSIYAGRLLNTVQRADMVGVFGSRLVLQGARDRVPEKADYINYTINRVGEVSLNQVASIAGDEIEEDKVHGNYFGIYSVVNYLGNLTSDVFMDDVRKTDVNTATADNIADGHTTYYQWKEAHVGKRNRNNGISANKVSLASGVYLEIQRESSEGKTEPDWGYVTGVIELDLINVMTGQGGGYVYAKNEHRTKTHHDDWDKVILSPYNAAARTYKKFTYDGASKEFETSGNFIHNTKQIIDDCYPIANKYEGADAVPAHYWYIKGSIYVYDQYISAYTGSATAYSETVSIPLTITAASHGQMTLNDIQPNLYAYYKNQVGDGELQQLGANDSVMVNNVHYRLNQPITYWDYNMLPESDKRYFVAETYVTVANCKIGDVTYEKGKVMLPEEYNALYTTDSIYNVDKDEKVLFTDVFRPSNNVSHDKGYVLTYEVNNPMVWNQWYTSRNGGLSDRKNTKEYNNETGYLPGPTYSVKEGRDGVYGQREYSAGDIITKKVYDTYMAIPSDKRTALTTAQASFEEAYLVKSELITKNKNNVDQHLYPGTTIAKSDYTDAQWAAITGNVAQAMVVTSTLDLGGGEYLYAGDLLTQADIDAIVAKYDNQTDESVKEYLDGAYYCTEGGHYGGSYYSTGVAYEAIDTWCSMSADDRANFNFNYDALDVLLDPTYANAEKQKFQYDSDQFSPRDPKLYSGPKPIDYEAVYKGTGFTYTQADGSSKTIVNGETYSREEYESIPNEKYYYSRIEVTKPGTYYVVSSPFARGERPYAAGEVITEDAYLSLTDKQRSYVTEIVFPAEKTTPKLDGEGNPVHDENGAQEYEPTYYYYCREYYTVGANGYQTNDDTELTVTDVFNPSLKYTKGQQVDQTLIISEENYNNLVNLQEEGFRIIGNAPVEVSTFYVSRESDINDLTKEKIITVVYLYEYQESDESGTHFTPISEHHVVNIHLLFKSGVPEIGELTKPNTVLPGSTVGLKVPTVVPGAYEVLNSGWEIFSNPQNAMSHKNGQPYQNTSTPMYWYQNGYYVAYYAKTYLGKTYSNAVEFSVANYHDIADVMADSIHHMYIDHEDVDRAPKIYIDNETPAAPNADKSELDLLKDLYDLTLNEVTYDSEHNPQPIGGDGKLKDHSGVNTSMIGAAKGLEFILQSDVSPKAYTDWTPIGDDEEHCFDGTLHGDGYTIIGLTNSLFNDLCGEVYNLGVTGSFTSAGLVNTGKGYVENCWVMSSAPTVDSNVKAVFGNPTDDKGTQVVNCYYPVSNAYSETEHARGNARKMTEEAFQNGEVTYDLNGFYLQKRYADNKPLTSGTKYSYFAVNGDGSLATEPTTAYYNSDYAIYPLDEDKEKIYGYVENRYADGDFIYAGGSVPETTNERLYNSVETGQRYYPIWPDDYLFFGQMLTYGHVNNRPYQDEPSHINKSGGRLTTVPTSVNRVYRAPAYFQSKEMGVAHYNPYAIFAAETADKSKEIYPNMTAIDFTGGNGDLAGGFKEGLQSDGKFFPPMLDDDGLTYFGNIDLTRNLLAYVPSATDNDADAESKTNDVVTSYLKDNTYKETNATYRTVAAYDLSQIKGHAVVKTGDDYVAHGSHLLVDKNDFNAPIAYDFDSSSRMWYQRVPDTYVDLTKGWEGISLPFSAELVTTQNKGEITHFYENSKFVDETTKTKVGHEYWLREFKGNVTAPNGEGIATGDFNYPMAGTDGDKEVTNTFLWDYYYKYSGAARQDQNTDTYQQEYYADTRSYSNYAFTKVAKPYIIGFPGVTYYEFDLSGQFVPANTKDGVAELRQQTITFASETGISVAVSDDEIANAKVKEGDYTFCPTYLGKSVPAGTFLLKADGSSYEKQELAATTVPFRPYFTYQPSGARENKVRALAFNRSQKNIGVEDRDPSEGAVGLLNVYAKKGRIVVESTLDAAVDVRIVTTGGNALQTFTIQPGETIKTRVSSTGIYIVTASNGQTKKLRVEAR